MKISLDIQSLTTQEKYRECSLMERSNENTQRSNNVQQRIVQVPLHEPAYLHCTIPHLKQNMVSLVCFVENYLIYC